MGDVTNPEVTDDNYKVDETTGDLSGTEDVQGNGEVITFTKEELNSLVGRNVDGKEDFNKHYKNLSSFVGKKVVKTEDVPQVVGDLQEKIAKMEKESAVKDFLLENPTAKEDLDIIEAYAEKHNMSLSEAFNSKFANRTKSSQNVINKNRINPIQAQQDADLEARARRGDEEATNELIMRKVYGKK